MTTVKSSDCRAKDPSTCRYHGAVLRMEKALANEDFPAYIAARDEVDALKQDPSNDLDPTRTLKDLPTDNVDPRTKERKEKRDKEERQRIAFLRDTAAVPTPMEAFALWVSVYESQGGSLKSYGGTYKSFGNVISNDPKVKAKNFDYESLAWSRWTPTKGGVPIPAGYGSLRLQLFILPDVVDQPMNKAGSIKGRPDNRPGWEWGHSEVYILERTENGGLKATTNCSNGVTTYADVEQFRKGKSLNELLASLQKAQSTQRPLDQ